MLLQKCHCLLFQPLFSNPALINNQGERSPVEKNHLQSLVCSASPRTLHFPFPTFLWDRGLYCYITWLPPCASHLCLFPFYPHVSSSLQRIFRRWTKVLPFSSFIYDFFFFWLLVSMHIKFSLHNYRKMFLYVSDSKFNWFSKLYSFLWYQVLVVENPHFGKGVWR